VDEAAMVEAVAAAGRLLGSPTAASEDLRSGPEPGGYVFAYDADTLGELERLVEQNGIGGPWHAPGREDGEAWAAR
jgi:hypothetical protein